MSSANSSFAFSQTASLNSVATDLNQFLNNTDYWASPDLPRKVDLKPILSENEQKYFNYRQYAGGAAFVRQQAQAASAGRQLDFSHSVTPDLQLSLQNPQEPQAHLTAAPTAQTALLDPRLYPKNVPRAAQAKNVSAPRQSASPTPSDAQSSDAEAQQSEWRRLMRRAQKVLQMRSQPPVTEQQIKLVFERLVGRLETEQAHGALPKCAQAPAKKGAVIKSVPASDFAGGASGLDCEREEGGVAAKRAQRRQNAKNGFDADENDENGLQSEFLGQPNAPTNAETVQKLHALFSTSTNSQLLQAAQAAKQAAPQLVSLKQNFMQAATRLHALTQYTPQASDFPAREGFYALNDQFPRRCELQFQAVESELLRGRETSRMRGRLCELLNVNASGVSLFDVIKQNNDIIAKIALQQNAAPSQQAVAFLAAEEFATRCAEAYIGVKPDDQQLITYADTVLAAEGAQRQKYAQQCVRRAVEEHPKLLIRLTDEEAFYAFQAIMFVFAHFYRLFNTLSIGRILTRLTEVCNFCDQSRSLLSAEKRILGLNQSCSASKLLEAVQAVAAQAANDAGVLSVDEAEKVMRALGIYDVSQIIPAINELKVGYYGGDAEADDLSGADSEGASGGESDAD